MMNENMLTSAAIVVVDPRHLRDDDLDAAAGWAEDVAEALQSVPETFHGLAWHMWATAVVGNVRTLLGAECSERLRRFTGDGVEQLEALANGDNDE